MWKRLYPLSLQKGMYELSAGALIFSEDSSIIDASRLSKWGASMTTTELSVRVDKGLKQEAEAILQSCGITIEAAFTALLDEVLEKGTLPLENAEKAKKDSAVLTLDELKEGVREIADKHMLKKVVLFGSYADGTAKTGSDIDLLIEYGDVIPTWGQVTIKRDLTEKFNRSVDVLVMPIKNDLLKVGKAVILYEKP